MKEIELDTLNKLYNDSDSKWRDHFTEMRSNIKLYLGLHYPKQSFGLQRLANQAPIKKEKKLRLTKNHIGVIMDKRINAITGHSPMVMVKPKHAAEVSDKKAADVGEAVWKSIQSKNKFDEKVDDFVFNYEVCGEAFAYTYFNPQSGDMMGYEPSIVDEIGEVIEQKPIYSGLTKIKNLEPFNVLIDPAARSYEDSEWVMFREMVSIEKLKKHFQGDKEAQEALVSSSEESFTIFDASTGLLSESQRDQALIKYIFYRPCPKYPEGHFAIFLSTYILSQGSLNGIFPIDAVMHTKATSNPRGFSIIKRLRGPQGEINRISSLIGQTQIYFKDRLLIQGGTKLSHGGTVSGTVGIRYNGARPEIMNAKSGDHYLGVLDHQISETYKLGMVSEEDEDKIPTADPRTLLFATLKQKKKFSKYSSKFENFLKDIAKTALKTAQVFYSDTHYIPAIDKKEWISIPEFKNIKEFDYSLDIKAMSQDVNTVLGESYAIEHFVQYAQSLDEEQIASLMANHPQLKDTSIVQEITADLRAVDDVFAQIERGETAPISEYDNHKYFMRKIANRMKESSFRFLEQPIQDLFKQRYEEHKNIEAQQRQAEMNAQAGMIPAGGALVTISGIKDANGNVLRLPYETIMDAVNKLQQQGSMNNIAVAELQNAQAVADLQSATQFNQAQTQQAPQPMAGGF